MHVLITGGAGFLARGMVVPFAEHGHELRLMDVAPFASPHQVVVGSVADPAQAAAALRGIDGLVVAHMAPRGPDDVNYRSPELPLAVNVAGTANLLHAAAAAGVRRAVVISSTAAVAESGDLAADPRSLPLRATGWYGLSKACQEVVAEHVARTTGMQIACLRVGYVLDGDANRDKYGRPVAERNHLDTDRRDIGEVARLCLERDGLGYQVLNVMSTRESLQRDAVQRTCDLLGWQPRYDFAWLREPAPAP